MTRSRPIQRAPWVSKSKPIAKPGSTIDPALRRQVRDRAEGSCELCGDRLGPVWECHHRKLRSRGGQDSVCNLVALCGTCHRRCHSHVSWATAQGFILGATADPARERLALRLDRWVRLCFA